MKDEKILTIDLKTQKVLVWFPVVNIALWSFCLINFKKTLGEQYGPKILGYTLLSILPVLTLEILFDKMFLELLPEWLSRAENVVFSYILPLIMGTTVIRLQEELLDETFVLELNQRVKNSAIHLRTQFLLLLIPFVNALLVFAIWIRYFLSTKKNVKIFIASVWCAYLAAVPGIVLSVLCKTVFELSPDSLKLAIMFCTFWLVPFLIGLGLLLFQVVKDDKGTVSVKTEK